MEFLSSSLGTNNQQPNINLAERLAETKDIGTIEQIALHLKSKDKKVASDCIKVMYELGSLEPQLIAEYLDIFIDLITSKNNRMVWGAMYAISEITPYKITEVNDKFGKIYNAYKVGSVITIDSCIAIFAEIVKADVSNSSRAYQVIIEHLKTCRAKEIPQHSEKSFICINGSNYLDFEKVLKDRFDEMSTSQQKRVKKVLKKIENEEFG